MKLLNNEKGLTLVEIMISMVVVAVLLIGIMIGNTVIQQANEAAFERTRAIQDTNQVMELMRRTAASGNFPSNVTSVYNGTVSGYTSLPSEAVTVSYVSATANPLDATVTVTWLENGRRAATSSLRALVTQR